MDHIISRLLTFGGVVFLGKAISALLGAYISYKHDPAMANKRSVSGLLRYCFPKELWTNRNVRIDACFTVLSRVTTIWLVLPIVLSLAAIVPMLHGGLTHMFGMRPPHPATLWLQLGLVVVCIIARDFMEFASHALSHRWQVLWEFHKVHHSSEFLSPLGEKRSHFMDDLWRNASISIVIGVCVATYCYAFGLPPVQGTLFGVQAYVVAYTIANVVNLEVLHHSHIPLSYGSFERFLISPAQHQLHHNRQGPSRNFGSFLSVWDRIFGSFAGSVPRGSFELGLPYEEQRNYNTLPEMLYRPFIDAARTIRNALRVGSQKREPGKTANPSRLPHGTKADRARKSTSG